MKLEKSDYQSIVNKIETGSNTLEYEKDGECLLIDYDYSEEGYFEDDHYCGTGAFVCTGKHLFINEASSFDKDGAETENDFDANKLYKLVA